VSGSPVGNPFDVAGRAAQPVLTLWKRLVDARDESGAVVDHERLADLPPAARRWVTRAIAPRARVARRVMLRMNGEIKVGRWLPFRAVQVLVPGDGFVWVARAGGAFVHVDGFDRYADGDGAMRWSLGGRVPIVRAGGRDVSRSAAGRLAGESVLVPSACVDRPWHADGEDAAVVSWDVHGEIVDVRIRVAGDGRLVSADFDRWGNPGRSPFGYHRFGVYVDDESTFDGMTIASSFRAGWWWGTDRYDADGEFFRANVTAAEFT
jgi:hypothetical protein